MTRERKPRFVLRLHRELRDCLDREAMRQGIRTATLAARLLESEAARGPREDYRLHPMLAVYTPTRNSNSPSAGRQMSIFVSPACREFIEALAASSGYRVRSVVPGMLLNTPACAALTRIERG